VACVAARIHPLECNAIDYALEGKNGRRKKKGNEGVQQQIAVNDGRFRPFLLVVFLEEGGGGGGGGGGEDGPHRLRARKKIREGEEEREISAKAKARDSSS